MPRRTPFKSTRSDTPLSCPSWLDTYRHWFTLTARRFKQLESIHVVRELRDSGEQPIAYNARRFILCGMRHTCVSSKRRRPRKRPAFTSVTALLRTFLPWYDVVRLAILPKVLTGFA
jgi:hypothetical protein